MIRLETDRLVLRDHEPRDLSAFCAIESDPEYRWPQPVHPRTELERSFREAWLPEKAFGLWAAELRPSGVYVGRCGLYPGRTDDGAVIERHAMIAFYLGREYWGRGLATEAGLALIALAFSRLELERIHAGIDAENLRSLRVIEKLGFSHVQSGEGGGRSWHDFALANPRHSDAAF